MTTIGFSTGALALGDFAQGIEIQKLDAIRACELSALREEELDGFLAALPELDLSHFHYLSFHAPSSLKNLNDASLVERIQPVLERHIPVVVHPDIIQDFGPWKQVGDLLLLENMDSRKSVCQSVHDLQWFFDQLPKARFCFDLGHARQIDPTMSVAADMLIRFRDRLTEVHISEVNWQCQHIAMSSAAQWAYRRVAPLIPRRTPVIIESMLHGTGDPADLRKAMEREIAAVKACLRIDGTKLRKQSSQIDGIET